jgi:hypothetical protein
MESPLTPNTFFLSLKPVLFLTLYKQTAYSSKRKKEQNHNFSGIIHGWIWAVTKSLWEQLMYGYLTV